MSEPAQKFEVVRDPITPARFGTPDLADKGMWMRARLKAKYGHLSDQWIMNWFAGAMSANTFYFVHTKNAVILAEAFSYRLNPQQDVRLWFAFARDPKDADHLADLSDLYDALMKWAANRGAEKVYDLAEMTDLPKPDIQKVLGGRLFVDEVVYAKVKK